MNSTSTHQLKKINTAKSLDFDPHYQESGIGLPSSQENEFESHCLTQTTSTAVPSFMSFKRQNSNKGS